MLLRAHHEASRHLAPTAPRHPVGSGVPVPRAHHSPAAGRRSLLLSGLVSVSWAATQPATARSAVAPPVGQSLPPAGIDGFVLFQPDARKTPAIRAGVIRPEFYKFAIPDSWSEGTILNILSGNFCMPKCDEPWYEALFMDEKEGKAQLIVSPLFRLVSKSGAALEDVGSPESVIEKVGSFITGTSLDLEDVVATGQKQFADGRTYYVYEVNAPYAKDGAHSLAAFTVKGDLAYLFVLTASDKQWARSEAKLRTMLETFRA